MKQSGLLSHLVFWGLISLFKAGNDQESLLSLGASGSASASCSSSLKEKDQRLSFIE